MKNTNLKKTLSTLLKTKCQNEEIKVWIQIQIEKRVDFYTETLGTGNALLIKQSKYKWNVWSRTVDRKG